MTLADLLSSCNAASIRLLSVGGRLQLRGPTVPREIRDAAAEFKETILALMPTISEPVQPPVPIQDETELADPLDADTAPRLVDAWMAIKLPEPVLFVDDEGFRWYQAQDPPGICREDVVGLQFTGTATSGDRTVAPAPPAGARIHAVDADARPCSSATSHMWSWEGGPEWYYSREYSAPENT